MLWKCEIRCRNATAMTVTAIAGIAAVAQRWCRRSLAGGFATLGCRRLLAPHILTISRPASEFDNIIEVYRPVFAVFGVEVGIIDSSSCLSSLPLLTGELQSPIGRKGLSPASTRLCGDSGSAQAP